jgi:hypothetical protein
MGENAAIIARARARCIEGAAALLEGAIEARSSFWAATAVIAVNSNTLVLHPSAETEDQQCAGAERPSELVWVA